MDAAVGVHLTGARKFFPGRRELVEQEPFPLELLAGQKLTSETAG